MKVIASVCERAAGRSGKTARSAKQAARQEQSSTTAMVRETLRKNSFTTNSHPPNPSGGNFTGPSNLPSFDSTSFDKSDAQVEAEAELELLMMQEEMNDLRLGAGETNWTQASLSSGDSLSHSSSNRRESGLLSGETERTSGSGGLELSPVYSSVSREGVAVGGVVATTAGVGGVRSQQLTVDTKEKERLDDIMAVAQ